MIWPEIEKALKSVDPQKWLLENQRGNIPNLVLKLINQPFENALDAKKMAKLISFGSEYKSLTLSERISNSLKE